MNFREIISWIWFVYAIAIFRLERISGCLRISHADLNREILSLLYLMDGSRHAIIYCIGLPENCLAVWTSYSIVPGNSESVWYLL